jgi:hypothetical protein
VMQFTDPCDIQVTLFATIWSIRAQTAVSADWVTENHRSSDRKRLRCRLL